jgi:hypothetical protein
MKQYAYEADGQGRACCLKGGAEKAVLFFLGLQKKINIEEHYEIESNHYHDYE